MILVYQLLAGALSPIEIGVGVIIGLARVPASKALGFVLIAATISRAIVINSRYTMPSPISVLAPFIGGCLAGMVTWWITRRLRYGKEAGIASSTASRSTADGSDNSLR